VVGKKPLNSTHFKYCYQVCAYKCFEAECNNYYVEDKGHPIPCIFSPPATPGTKGKCNEDTQCI
jgi:hypothetical protein